MLTLLALVAAAPCGTSTRPVVPRMPSEAVGVVIDMLPVLATAAATNATVPLAMSNTAALFLAVLINVIIDRDLRVGPEIECGFIVEGDAERGAGRGLDH